MRKRIGETQDTTAISHRKTSPQTSIWWKAAAIFLIGFALSWFIFKGTSGSFSETSDYHIVSTPLGSQSTIQLPDGSRVVMNAGSQLKYPQNFNSGTRQVYLEGEAFFNIAEKRRKFIVNTSDIAIKVYGTTFNVKAYPDEKTVETTLIEGKISVIRPDEKKKRKKKELALSPNQRLVIYKGGRPEKSEIIKEETKAEDKVEIPVRKDRLILSRNIEPEIFTSWKDGHLIIESEPMKNLAVKLQRKYNVQFHFEDDSVGAVRFSGRIEDETIEQVMAAMELASPLRYRIEDRDIWIGIAEKEGFN
jgi:ferric-dicitrate binding protein FerR (iron transport regulator)